MTTHQHQPVVPRDNPSPASRRAPPARRLPHLPRTGRLLGLLLLACRLPAAASDTLVIRTNYYNVVGETPQAILQSLSQSAPWKQTVARHAQTRWDVRWDYRLQPTPHGCFLQNLRTETRITITLPRWVPSPQTSTNLVAAWSRYFLALARHEDGHRQKAVAAAAAIRHRLGSLGPHPSSDTLRDNAQRLAQSTLDEHRAQDDQYDRQTQHGATQGARFP